MRLVYLLLSLFVFAFTTAQTNNSAATTSKPKLTEQEVSKAKELYGKMMETETYKLGQKGSKALVKKLKGLDVFPVMKEGVHWTRDSLKTYTYTLIEKNLSKTGFTSVEEAKELIEANTALMSKQVDENKELYDLMGRATIEQLREIHDKKFQEMNDRRFGSQED